jgi:hypothetical protein
MAQLAPEVEQQLSELSDADWAALVARVRPPASQPGDSGRAEAQRRFGKSQAPK